MDEIYIVKLYYDWLIDSIDDFDDKVTLYEHLLECLFNTDFVWLKSVPLDENRSVEGLKLRKEYAKKLSQEDADILMNNLQYKSCSLLEMFIAFADKLTEIIDIQKAAFFWMFIDNLGLGWATEYDFDIDIVTEILNDFMFGRVHGHEPVGNEKPPVLFPCREVYANMNDDLFMQANLYLKSYFL